MNDDSEVVHTQADASTAATSPAGPSPTQSLLRRIFIGRSGLRAGWRLAIFLLIVFALGSGLRLVARILHLPTGGGNITALTPLGVVASAGTGFLLTAVAAWIMSKIEGRKFGQYGLPASQAFRKDLWVGMLWGFLATSGTVLMIFVLHGVRITRGPVHGQALLASAAAWGLAFLFVGFNEEFGFRGYIQYTLTTGIGFWPSAILISGLFGLAHAQNSGENVFGELSVVLFGLLFCLFLRRRGSLWWAVGFHLGYDWTETFFWGAPDSGLLPTQNFLSSTFAGPKWLTGGPVGPEASMFTPICLLIVAILFSLVYRENLYRTGTPAASR
ncbi:MAG: CPBP family intramembrane metalloprotease [Acidobacteriia bacterium]|nr:CPBP family intramembrane metalloprotease [Terriglobia bacterium]